MRPFDDGRDHVLRLGAGEHPPEDALDGGVGPGGDRRGEPVELRRQQRLDLGLEVDGLLRLVGEVGGEGGLHVRLGDRVADEVGHRLAAQDRDLGPHPDETDHQQEDGEHAEHRRDDAAGAVAAAAGWLLVSCGGCRELVVDDDRVWFLAHRSVSLDDPRPVASATVRSAS